MMVPYTTDNYDFNNLTLEKPIKLDDVYVSYINFTFQTPKLNIKNISSKKIKLILDDNTEKILNDFDDYIIKLISHHSTEYFEETLSIEDADEIYKHSFKQSKKENVINLNINNNISIYNKKEQLNLDVLSDTDIIISLLKCTKIIFYKNYCEPCWEILQIKIKQPKEPKQPKLDKNTYLFMDDVNDTYIDKSIFNDTDQPLNKKEFKFKM